MLQPQDGLSLVPLFAKEIGPRSKPLPFRSRNRLAMIDNDYKLLSFPGKNGRRLELYNLVADVAERKNLIKSEPEIARRMREQLEASNASIEASKSGKDYPEGKVGPQPPRIFWSDMKAYQPYFEEWKKRPEFGYWLKRRKK
jgi:hypothetical protein